MIKNTPAFILFLCFFLYTNFSVAQGSVCADSVGDDGADPFCSTTGILFPNCNSSNSSCARSSEVGPDYGCLDSQPFPAWYYLQIEDGGLLNFNIVQTANEDGTGAQLDVDFICYGPFSNPVSPCVSELTRANTVDCSYLPDATETMTIPSAIAGEYYLILITNFSQQPGFISFQQTSGAGSTDCTILEAALGPNQDICGFDPVVLDGESDGAVRYEWSVYNETTMVFEIITGETNPIYTVTTTGRYQLLIEDVDGDTETDEIIITFNSIPTIASAPQDIILCEVSSDSAEFDLSNNTSLILGGQDPVEFSITYYLSQNDADIRQNSVSEVFTTIATRVFARIENVNLTSCYETSSFELFVNPIPNLSETNYNYTICEPIDGTPDQATLVFSEVLTDLVDNTGESADLLANDEPLALGDFSITYHNSVVDAIAGVNPIIDGAPINDGDIIFVRVENNQLLNPTGCFNTDNIAGITVSVTQIPEVNTIVPDLLSCATSVENPNIAVFDLRMNDALVSVINNPAGSQVLYYASQQDFDANNPITNANSFINTRNPQTIISAVVNSSAACGRSAQTSFDIEVLPLPTLLDNQAFSGRLGVCVFPDGTVQDLIMIGEDIGASDGESYIYDWTPDNIDADNDGNEDAIYFVNQLTSEQVFNLVITRVNSLGTGVDCDNSINPETLETYQITLLPSSGPVSVGYEVAEPSFSGSYTITAIPELLIGDPSDLEYSLDGVVFQDSPVFTNVSGGDYEITVRNRRGCQPVAVSELIQLLDYERYFTPNGDGFHETWNLVNIENQPTALIYIFDRQGRLLKQIRPGGPGWDGTYNGNLMPSSEYWFRVEFNEPTDPNMSRSVFAGSFSLIR